MDVVILAGGDGRRFGGVKQLEPVGPRGEALFEITLRDARRAGCDRAVLVVAPGREAEFAALLAARPIEGLTVSCVTQRIEDLPGPAVAGRTRPWGTGHALWAARDVVSGPFLLFNADDSYGPSAPAALVGALAGGGNAFAMLGYRLDGTLSSAGTVSRAVCDLDADGCLRGLVEYPAIAGDRTVVDGPEPGRVLPADALVSMNAWAFTPAVFPLLERTLTSFLAAADPERGECYLPAAVDAAVRRGDAMVRVVPAADRWCGLTWPEDLAVVRRRFAADDGEAR